MKKTTTMNTPSNGHAKPTPDTKPVVKPAYITSLSIENIKCFGPKQTLDLTYTDGKPARWTVILGDNGVGKTTLMKAIFVMRPLEEITMAGEDRRYSQSMSTLFEHFRNSERTMLSRQNETKGMMSLFLLQTSLKTQITKLNVPIELTVSVSKNSATSNLHIGDLGGFVLYCYSASRTMGNVSFIENLDWNNPKMQNFDQDLLNAEEWLLKADYIASKHADRKDLRIRRDKIRQVLVEILPDISELRFHAPEIYVNPRIQFLTPYGWVYLNDLSLGYKTMISWIVDLAARLFERYTDSSDPLSEPAIVLVDEIDLHMHPSWQQKIISYLTDRFPNVQFIVTAHSPLIVQSAQDANIVVLRREGDHVVIDNNPVNVRHWRVDQLLTSDLFGLESARPLLTEKLFDERRSLLGKKKLTSKEQKRLGELKIALESVPTAETPDDIEAMELIRSVAKRIKERENGK